MKCSEVYVCDADRYSMQMLAELVGKAIHEGVITKSDLYSDEPTVIAKFLQHPGTKDKWLRFCAMNRIVLPQRDTPMSRVINAKRRCIDPYVDGQGRVSEICLQYRQALDEFRGRSLDYRIEGRSS